MEKLIYLLWKTQSQHMADFRRNLLTAGSSLLKNNGAINIRLNIADHDVEAAQKKRIISTRLATAPDAMLSLWLDSASQYAALEKILSTHCQQFCSYLVTESEPLVNNTHRALPGQRTTGMNQIVFLRVPSRLTRNEWLDLWLEQHTPVAIATQSTFGYRQNIVTRILTDNPLTKNLAIDAIVEENFPVEAMTSAHAFYKAINDDGKYDDALLRKNQAAMFASVQRFIDLDKLDCLPMSEYNF